MGPLALTPNTAARILGQTLDQDLSPTASAATAAIDKKAISTTDTGTIIQTKGMGKSAGATATRGTETKVMTTSKRMTDPITMAEREISTDIKDTRTKNILTIEASSLTDRKDKNIARARVVAAGASE